MTIPEAAQLVLQAGALGEGGDVFVLDMGDPIKIDDLARSMIHLSGFEVCEEENPNGDIKIDYVGLRSGEKLYEELLIGNNVSGTQHPKIMRAEENKLPWEEILRHLSHLEAASKKLDSEKIRNILIDAVSEYQPNSDIVDPVWNYNLLSNSGTSLVEDNNEVSNNIPKAGKELHWKKYDINHYLNLGSVRNFVSIL